MKEMGAGEMDTPSARNVFMMQSVLEVYLEPKTVTRLIQSTVYDSVARACTYMSPRPAASTFWFIRRVLTLSTGAVVIAQTVPANIELIECRKRPSFIHPRSSTACLNAS
jgi:hypothetical protein